MGNQDRRESALGDLDSSINRGWNIAVRDGTTSEWQDIRPAMIVATQQRLGLSVSYGLGRPPEQFDRFMIREPGGGGVAVLPYIVTTDGLYIGSIRQHRLTTSGEETSIVRGFLKLGEDRLDAAKREFQEETGLKADDVMTLVRLPGKPVNANSTFFIANPRDDEGVVFFGGRVSESIVAEVRKSDDPVCRVYSLRSEVRLEMTEDESEPIVTTGLRFLHQTILSLSSDALTLAGITRLRLYLR